MTHTETISAAELIKNVAFNDQGLVPVIAQDHANGSILMMAWMNAQALRITMESKDVTYYSRSRQKLWRKGETSGHTQKLVEAYLDCDGDTLLLKVQQTGPACHTGAANCFFRLVK